MSKEFMSRHRKMSRWREKHELRREMSAQRQVADGRVASFGIIIAPIAIIGAAIACCVVGLEPTISFIESPAGKIAAGAVLFITFGSTGMYVRSRRKNN